MGNFNRRVRKAINKPALLLDHIVEKYLSWLPDKTYLSFRYRLRIHRKMNWKDPKTYNEKLNWLKLHDHRPVYITMADKYEAKKFVAEIIGEQFIIPTIGVWDRAEDIEWDKLPNQFVLKCNHDSGGLVICKDKTKLDKVAAIGKLSKGLKYNYYKVEREWPYKDMRRRIIAEEYVEPKTGKKDLPDYKFFCFDGKVKFMFIGTDRQTPGEEVKFDFFDADFNYLHVRQGHDHAKTTPSKPACFEQMKRAAEALSKGLPHVRVDFYQVDGKVLFGELTLYHFGGLVPFEPEEWDLRFGEMLVLPSPTN